MAQSFNLTSPRLHTPAALRYLRNTAIHVRRIRWHGIQWRLVGRARDRRLQFVRLLAP